MLYGRTDSKGESTKLSIFYGFIDGPEGDLWVNLSPYEKDRIVPEGFGQTTWAVIF